MDICANTKTGSNKLAVAICSGLYLAKFIVVHPPMETPTICTLSKPNPSITSFNHSACCFDFQSPSFAHSSQVHLVNLSYKQAFFS